MADLVKRDINVPAGQSRLSRRERDTGHPPLGGVPCPDTPTVPAALVELANRVRRLVPSHRDPEAFHEAKSEIEAELRRLARGGRSEACAERGLDPHGSSPLPSVAGPEEPKTLLERPRLSAKVSGLRKA